MRLKRHLGILILLAVFLFLGTAYSVVTPLFEASDELWHYPFVQFLATGHGLPIQDASAQGPWRQEGSQPPLYYGLAALASRWAPSGDWAQVLQRNPHADIGIPRPDGNANMIAHTAAEDFPYHGAALAVHLAREFSVILGMLTVLFAYLAGLEILPGRRDLALAAAAVVAFTPMFLFISGSVNNDNLLVTCSTAAFWLLLRQVNRMAADPPALDRRQPAGLVGMAKLGQSSGGRRAAGAPKPSGAPSLGPWLLIGAVIGLAALSKVSGLTLLPLAALVLAWVAWRRCDWRIFFVGGTCVVGAAAVVAGWWYVRNFLLYHDPLGFNVFVSIVGPRSPVPTLRQLLGEWQGFVMAYWGFYGGVNVPAPEWFYRVLNSLALVGAAGLLVGLARRIWQQRRVDVDRSFRLFLVAVWPLIVMVGLVRWTLLTIASQGRLIFPAIAALSYLLVLGLASWLQPWGRTRAGSTLTLTLPLRRVREPLEQRALHYAFLPPPQGEGQGEGGSGAAAEPTQAAKGRGWRWSLVPVLLAVALMAGLAVWTPWGVIAPAYARPPLLTEAQIAAIPNRLDLTLGDDMELLGYQISASEVHPGQEVAVTLYWRAKAPLSDNYTVFVHLLTDSEVIVGQRDVYPGRGSFPTREWRAGDAIADTYIIQVSPTTFSPSKVQVEAGLYLQPAGARLPIRAAGGRELGDYVRFGQVLVRAEPKDGIANPLYINLDNKVALVGYDLDRTSVPAGETLHLTLYWRCLAPLSKNYTVFAQVLGANDQKWAQKDAWPQEGAAPTSTWKVGQVVRDSYELRIDPAAPAGVCDLQVGMYLSETMTRLGVLGAGGHLQDTRVLLNKIRVLR
jgi:hypothetical protein